jgi:hypothetical protein
MIARILCQQIDIMSAVTPPVPAHASLCANCATPLEGSFCHVCGQRAHVHKSLLHLGEEVLHGVLHFDAKGLRTLPMLIAHPGDLTRRYIDGHRTRYVSPLALFLFMVVAMFFVASLTSEADGGKSGQDLAAGPQSGLAAQVAASKQEVAKAKTALAMAKMKGGDVAAAQEEVDDAEALQATLERSVTIVQREGQKIKTGTFTANTPWPSVNAALRHAADNPELAFYKLKSAGAKYSFLLVPISLPFLWLLFCRRRDITMYDHAVFALYSLSFMSLLVAALFILKRVGLTPLALILLFCVPPVHMFVQLRGTYGLSRFAASWRTGALMLVSALVMSVYLLLILMLSIR